MITRHEPATTKVQRGRGGIVAITGVVLMSAAAAVSANGSGGSHPPSTSFSKAPVVEWDLPVDADGRPGAISIDLHSSGGNKVWFVTRDIAPRVFSLETGKNLKHDWAKWTSWRLDTIAGGTTGGLKKLRSSRDRRFVFVRNVQSVQKIDTQSCRTVFDPVAGNTTVCDLTVFQDDLPNFQGVSDLAVDSKDFVYSVVPNGDPAASFVQRITATATRSKCGNLPCPEAEIVRWNVGGGVGDCVSALAAADPCIAGVAVHPKYENLVYVSEFFGNNISELDTTSKSCSCLTPKSRVRSWSLAAVGASGPKQINVDGDGIVWVITSSNDLVSLNPKTDRMTRHQIPASVVPDGFQQDSFGVAPDGGMIGYTATDPFNDKHKVGMLAPKGHSKWVPPATRWVDRVKSAVQPRCEEAARDSGSVKPIGRSVPVDVTRKTDGTFFEALINRNTQMTETRQSRVPLGITPDRDRSVGAFFYAVGEPAGPDMTAGPLVNRVGLQRLSKEDEKGKKDRDDEDSDDDGKKRGEDDDDDDDGVKNDVDNDDDGDGTFDFLDDDDDNDGIKNEHDRKDAREAQDRDEVEMAGGQADDFELTAQTGTLAFIATATARTLSTPVSIELLNQAGTVVARTPQLLGAAVLIVPTPAAGLYTVRVKNHSLTGDVVESLRITRNPAPLNTPNF